MTDSNGCTEIAVTAFLSPARLRPYLQAAAGDDEKALELYEWSARMASAAFELIAHLEVGLRNALDAQLRMHVDEQNRGIPWLFCSPPVNHDMQSAISITRDRLRARDRESRDQITAHLSFGFWSGMLTTSHEDLWRKSLHRSFPYSDGRRKTVGNALEGIRKFRNRVAHHDSLLNIDIPFEVERIFTVAGYLHPGFKAWLQRIDRTHDVYGKRPVNPIDTVIVSTRQAWIRYESLHAYICQPGRWFNAVTYLGFYTDQEIKTEIPVITGRRDDVPWTRQEAARLRATGTHIDRKIATVIEKSLNLGDVAGMHQVFLLSSPKDRGHTGHRTLPHAIPHPGRGRGSAFVHKHRYFSLHALETAADTTDLTSSTVVTPRHRATSDLR